MKEAQHPSNLAATLLVDSSPYKAGEYASEHPQPSHHQPVHSYLLSIATLEPEGQWSLIAMRTTQTMMGMTCASAQQKRGTYRLKPHDQLTSFSYCALAITECNYFQPFKIYIGLERKVDAGVFVVFLLRKRGTLISEKIYI